MKALPKRKGNSEALHVEVTHRGASMKALPKRKGNLKVSITTFSPGIRLNESPSEKEGKFAFTTGG